MRTCEVEACEKPLNARKMCLMHYTRWKRHGDPLFVKRLKFVSETCTLDGCERPYDSKGYCSMHYTRWLKHGDTQTVTRRWSGGQHSENVGYGKAHEDVARARGKASEHRCAHCARQAQQWAYDHKDPNPLITVGNGRHYSADPNHYIPLCCSCHKILDLN